MHAAKKERRATHEPNPKNPTHAPTQNHNKIKHNKNKMITTARIISRHAARANVAPRAAAALGSTRSMAIGDALGKKVGCLNQTVI